MDRLDQIFRCTRFGLLAHRHCLRRQVEQQATDRSKARSGSFAWCSDSCEQGRGIRNALSGLTARACETCGTAIIGLREGAPCAACEERRQVLEVPRVLSRRVPVSSRIWSEPLSIESTNEVVVAAQESTPGAEEPMAEVAGSSERPICSVCHETPLRSHNRSGICTACKRNTRSAARPTLAARTVRATAESAWPPVADASDEYLVEAVQELAHRITRIRAEAAARLEKLNGALEVLEAAKAG